MILSGACVFSSVCAQAWPSREACFFLVKHFCIWYILLARLIFAKYQVVSSFIWVVLIWSTAWYLAWCSRQDDGWFLAPASFLFLNFLYFLIGDMHNNFNHFRVLVLGLVLGRGVPCPSLFILLGQGVSCPGLFLFLNLLGIRSTTMLMRWCWWWCWTMV